MPNPPRRPVVVLPVGRNVVIPPGRLPARGAPPNAPPPATLAPRARLDALVAELRSIKDQMSKMVYRTGTILAELRTEQMITLAECASFDELLEKYELTNRITAMKYIAVAESFSEPVAVQLGVEKGYALVRYSAALGERARKPEDLLLRNARIGGVAVADIKPAEIFGAIKQLRERARAGADDDTAAEADKAVRKLGARLRRAGAPGAKLRRGRRGAGYRVIIELDPDEAMALAESL